mmetsp:Transcript_19366/g.56639  ORF Transcript_19366/g.56639 Transcript_19366/m.56639 type:complete len:231 (-) Transcript_19366:1368-2060(-)
MSASGARSVPLRAGSSCSCVLTGTTTGRCSTGSWTGSSSRRVSSDAKTEEVWRGRRRGRTPERWRDTSDFATGKTPGRWASAPVQAGPSWSCRRGYGSITGGRWPWPFPLIRYRDPRPRPSWLSFGLNFSSRSTRPRSSTGSTLYSELFPGQPYSTPCGLGRWRPTLKPACPLTWTLAPLHGSRGLKSTTTPLGIWSLRTRLDFPGKRPVVSKMGSRRARAEKVAANLQT